MALSTAQIIDNCAGRLDPHGATGGPVPLTTEPFFISVNSSVHFLLPQFEQPGGLVTPGDGQFTPAIFNPFDSWVSMPAISPRAAVARGQAIFNSKPINITGVAGINDDLSADRKSTRLNSSHLVISYAVFCLKKKNITISVIYYISDNPSR